MVRSEETSRVVSPDEVATKMRLDYSRGVRDHTTKVLESVCDLVWSLERPMQDIDALVKNAAEMISKHFGIASVAVALRDPVDGLYRYPVVVGVDDEVRKGFADIAYTKEQLRDEGIYKSDEVSRHTKLYLSEHHPYADGEEFSYNRPALIGMKRRSTTDSLEADYLDVFMYDNNGDVLGYIELSGTRLRKLPDATTIKWIELIASILGLALRSRR